MQERVEGAIGTCRSFAPRVKLMWERAQAGPSGSSLVHAPAIGRMGSKAGPASAVRLFALTCACPLAPAQCCCPLGAGAVALRIRPQRVPRLIDAMPALAG